MRNKTLPLTLAGLLLVLIILATACQPAAPPAPTALPTQTAAILTPSGAHSVTIAFPENIPPWVIQGNQTGIAVDIVREALQLKGYTLRPEYVPFVRQQYAIETGAADGVAMVEGEKITGDYFYSEETTRFTTVLVSLKEKNYSIATLKDLQDKRITAFPGAKLVFKEIGEVAAVNPNYVELGGQEGQVVQLFKLRTDLILLDKSVFLYWRKETKLVDSSASVQFHDLSPFPTIIIDSPTQTVFKSESLRDAFNDGLRQLRESGRYDQIVEQYTELK